MTWTYLFDVSDYEFDGFATIHTETFLQPQKVTVLMQMLNAPKYIPHILDSKFLRVQEVIGGMLIGERTLPKAIALDIINDVDKRTNAKVFVRLRLDNIPHSGMVEYLDTQYFDIAPEIFDTVVSASVADKMKLDYYRTFSKNVVYNMYVMKGNKMWYGRQHSLAEIASAPTFHKVMKEFKQRI
jgi:hypothetical protein